VPHPFRFFLRKGWETTSLNRQSFINNKIKIPAIVCSLYRQ
jgi:hypothetical protein